ncbi:MAG: alkyl/aryl-sulfatase [Gammaproteobacteria bacterium]
MITGHSQALFITALLAAAAPGPQKNPAPEPTPVEVQAPAPQEASISTMSSQAQFLKSLPFGNMDDFTHASQNLLKQPKGLNIMTANGAPVWSLDKFMTFENMNLRSPDTVNPSLWRMSLLNMNYGLFKVIDQIYQIRGYDISVMTIIDAGNGYVVVDPLMSAETAKAGLDLVNETVGPKPVIAVIYTHSHVDHFGGVRGIVDEADVKSGKVQIIAPIGFMEHAISENVMAGNAMSRRAMYMYGSLLPQDPKGSVDAGLGKAVSSGTVTLIPPTHSVAQTGELMTLGNLAFEFQLTPNTEAPSEMNFFIPSLHALCMAENITHTLHNLYSLRGATVRDAVSWVKHINESIKRYGDSTTVMFSSHHWPTWGHDEIITLMENQRDAYKYIHDQTLRLANEGHTMTEIAEMVALPANLQATWADRGYYGTVNHDVKAVYQRYLGWFDANPSHLYPLPPVETSKKSIEYMGGAAAVIEKAKKDYDAGQYRWVAQVLNEVVFADPQNTEARHLLANALEQMGYQAESAPWRNFYLTGAQELRNGVKSFPAASTVSPDIVAAMPMDMILDYLAIRLNGPKAANVNISMNWVLPDLNQQYRITVKNGVLNYFPGEVSEKADVTVTFNRAKLNEMILGSISVIDSVKDGSIKLNGNAGTLSQFIGLLDKFDLWFNVVTP